MQFDDLKSTRKLRMTDENPYCSVFPEPLLEAATPPPLPPPPPPAPTPAVQASYQAPMPDPQYLEPEEVDIMDTYDAQKRSEASDESISGAMLGGFGAAMLCVGVAASVGALTGFWPRVFSVAIGFVVAVGVRRFGHGDDQRFGCIGAFWSLLACFVAYHIALAFVLAA